MTIKNQVQPPKVGDYVTFRKTMTVAEQAMLTGISGNLGGLYVDRRAAASAGLPDMALFGLAAASPVVDVAVTAGRPVLPHRVVPDRLRPRRLRRHDG